MSCEGIIAQMIQHDNRRTANPHTHTHTYIHTQPEVLNELREGIIAQMIQHDNRRTANPSAVQNRIVFDSIEPNPLSKERSVPPPGQVCFIHTYIHIYIYCVEAVYE